MHKKQIRYIKPFNLLAVLCNVILFFLLSIYGYANRYPSVQNNDNALHIAAKNGDIDRVKTLLKYQNVKVNEKSHGCTPLCIAAEQGHVEVVKALLGAKEIKINEKESRGCTPLYIAVFKNYVEIVKVLLSVHGIDINLETNAGESALDLARENNHLACVGLLEKALKKQS